MIAFLAVVSLFGLMGVVGALRSRSGRRASERRGPVHDEAGGPEGYPESLTAVLGRDEEAYLAWLADHHWPDDEYLLLEREWLREAETFGVTGPVAPPGPTDTLEPPVAEAGEDGAPVCPGCRLPADDVWPCHACGRTLHAACGHGMRRRRLAHPYRTPDMDAESVTAEWICVGCSTIIGLDVERGPDRGGPGGDPGPDPGGERCR